MKTPLTRGQLGKPIDGIAFPKQALHKTAVCDLKFYVLSDAEGWDLWRSLSEELCSFYIITDFKHQNIEQSVMAIDDLHRLHDMLVYERIGPNEAQPYQPLPVLPLEPLLAVLAPRQPLSNVSGNVQQPFAVSIAKEPPALIAQPETTNNIAVVIEPPAQADPVVDVAIAGTAHITVLALDPSKLSSMVAKHCKPPDCVNSNLVLVSGVRQQLAKYQNIRPVTPRIISKSTIPKQLPGLVLRGLIDQP